MAIQNKPEKEGLIPAELELKELPFTPTQNELNANYQDFLDNPIPDIDFSSPSLEVIEEQNTEMDLQETLESDSAVDSNGEDKSPNESQEVVAEGSDDNEAGLPVYGPKPFDGLVYSIELKLPNERTFETKTDSGEANEEGVKDNQHTQNPDNPRVEEQGEKEPKPKANMRIKEVKYGMTVITNIGNYENIRTHIEAVAEIDSNDDFLPSIEELSNHIRKVGRNEYREIKRKNSMYQ